MTLTIFLGFPEQSAALATWGRFAATALAAAGAFHAGRIALQTLDNQRRANLFAFHPWVVIKGIDVSLEQDGAHLVEVTVENVGKTPALALYIDAQVKWTNDVAPGPPGKHHLDAHSYGNLLPCEQMPVYKTIAFQGRAKTERCYLTLSLYWESLQNVAPEGLSSDDIHYAGYTIELQKLTDGTIRTRRVSALEYEHRLTRNSELSDRS